MKYLLIFTVLFFSCEDKQRFITVCDCSQKEKVAEFVQKSIKDANNMSDEEMEDVITELRKTAITLHCSQTMGTYKHNGDFVYESVKQDSCLTYYPYHY